MASRKDYTYQIKGNKLSLLERDQTSGTGLNYVYAGVDGDGVMDGTTSGSISLTSPVAAVTDGIELEYAYSPVYTNTGSDTMHVDRFGINGWTVVDGYLTFIRVASPGLATVNWTSSPYTATAVDSYISITDSNKWNGTHKIKSVGTDGLLQTYTEINFPTTIVSGSSDVDIGLISAAYVAGKTYGYLLRTGLDAQFGAGDYIYASGFSNVKDDGMYRVAALDTNTLYIDARYWSKAPVENSVYGTSLSTEQFDEWTDGADSISLNIAGQSNVSANIRTIYRDFCLASTSITALEDEGSNINVSSYLSKALVYYVKAKVAEDQVNIEVKEYMMREFRRMLEKHESSKVAGPRGIMTGSHSIR